METIVEEGSVTSHKIKYKRVPPDGGWGYAILLALCIMFTVTQGPVYAFGILYGSFLSEISDEATATTIIGSIFDMIACFMGLVTNLLIQKEYSCRFVGLLGAIFFSIGSIISIFVNSVPYLIVSYGILQGSGFGLMLTATFSSFNTYFVSRKSSTMGLAQTVIAASGMGMPYVARVLMDTYGFRGAVTVMAAIGFNSIFAMMTLHPVQWHMKQVRRESGCWINFEADESVGGNVDGQSEKSEQLAQQCKQIENDINGTNIVYTIDEGSSTQLERCENETEAKTNKTYLWSSLSNFLQISLLRDPIFVNISVGMTMAFVSDNAFVFLLPMFLSHMNYDKGMVALLVTIFMAADVVGRMIFSILTAFVNIRSRYLFTIGTLVTAGARLVFIFDSEWYLILTLCIVLGLFRCLIQVTVPLVLAEYCVEKFTATYGLYLALSGIMTLVVGQITGAVATLTGKDSDIVIVLNVLLLLCGIPWLIELIITSRRKK